MAYIERAVSVGITLNFKIVSGLEQPLTPKASTVWINTDVAIGNWQMKTSAPTTRPDGSARQTGDIWLQLGYSGNIEINAIKKNGIFVYIVRAFQWDGAEWVEKPVKAYQNGNWVDTTYYLFNADFGINRGNWVPIDDTVAELTVTADSLYLASGSYTYGRAYNDEAIDLTAVNSIIFNIIDASISSQWGAWAGVISSAEMTDANQFTKVIEITGTGSFSLNVSELQGKHYIKLQSGNRGSNDNGINYLRLDNIEFN